MTNIIILIVIVLLLDGITVKIHGVISPPAPPKGPCDPPTLSTTAPYSHYL